MSAESVEYEADVAAVIDGLAEFHDDTDALGDEWRRNDRDCVVTRKDRQLGGGLGARR
jgi:hypothetical protein